MRNRKGFVLSTIALAVWTLTQQVQAQEVAATATEAVAAAKQAPADDKLNQVVVTGSTSLKRTVRESSVAVTSADRADLDRKAPRSTASALELIPGMMVEDSGGEVSNNYTVRGLAGGGQNFVQLSEDGLPVFYHPGLADTILKQELSIDRMEAVRGGTSGILTVNGAGATVNFITVRSKDEPEGVLRLTGSDYGTKRIDIRYGGAIGNGWYAGFGGFYRNSDSVRDVGFTADHGGLLRAYVGRKWGDGEFSVNIKLVDDHNTFLLPTPFQNPSHPEPVPGFNGNYGTLLSPDNAVQAGRNSNGVQTNDLTEGVATKSGSIGYNFEKRLSDAFTLRSKGRYTNFKNDFNAVFTFDNNSLRSAADRLNPALNGDISAMLARFPGTMPAIRGVASGTIYAGANLANVSGNGLLTDNISAKNRAYRQNFVNDVSLTWTTARNSLTAGLLTINQDEQSSNDGNTRFLGEVRNNPARLDIVAIDGARKVVGQLTDKGVLEYNPWGVGVNRSSLSSQNFYLNDEYQFNDRLRLDAGARLEHLRYRAWRPQGSTVAIPGSSKPDGTDADNIMVNNTMPAFNGQYDYVDNGSTNNSSLTAGGNYLINDNLAAYARYSKSYQANNENPVTPLSFGELGARYQRRGFSASLTVFRTNFKDYQFSRLLKGDSLETRIAGDIVVNGLEYDLQWKPVRYARLNVTGVVQHSTMKIKSVSGPSAGTVDTASLGSHPERVPDHNFTITPTLLLPDNKGEVYLSYHQVGKRYSDAANSFVLPSYHTVALGANYQLSPTLALNFSVQNLTNSIGLTEGNPRAGFTEVASGNYFFARSILGRNMQLSLTASF
ncbi:TonB-dependent receptor [Undibacterium sp. TS12]|uniref:TonB-dependent receptor n=1 Tax=Undibacterium sp. TS12 TaxID=2908202 RepID=UPI001F4CF332|nr:TonB-dependent receptor [Undibacterium sp. TS12]MCH8621456.1 TonB-dependent receptor [Undibacterium sp. TS12]